MYYDSIGAVIEQINYFAVICGLLAIPTFVAYSRQMRQDKQFLVLPSTNTPTPGDPRFLPALLPKLIWFVAFFFSLAVVLEANFYSQCKVDPTYYSEDSKELLGVALKLLREMNISHIISDGTLLAVLRGTPKMIWDPDFDVYIEAPKDFDLFYATLHARVTADYPQYRVEGDKKNTLYKVGYRHGKIFANPWVDLYPLSFVNDSKGDLIVGPDRWHGMAFLEGTKRSTMFDNVTYTDWSSAHGKVPIAPGSVELVLRAFGKNYMTPFYSRRGCIKGLLNFYIDKTVLLMDLIATVILTSMAYAGGLYLLKLPSGQCLVHGVYSLTIATILGLYLIYLVDSRGPYHLADYRPPPVITN